MTVPERQRSVGAPTSRQRFSGAIIPKEPAGTRKHGLTLIELLCVIAIIGILAAMYFGVLSKVFVHVKKMMGH